MKYNFSKDSPVIKRRLERMRRFWAGEDIGRPTVSIVSNIAPYRQNPDRRIMMDNAIKTLEREAELPGDHVPYFWPDVGTIAFSSAFGGKLVYEDDNRPWIEPIIHNSKEAAHIKMPSPTDGLLGEALSLAYEFLDKTHGEGFVSTPDIQGPTNIVSLIWDSTDFWAAFYEEPGAVREILKMATDLIIDTVKLWRDQFKDNLVAVCYPFIWMPKELGINITQDNMPVLSPHLYEEFEVPLICQISETFGGLYIHCCGDFEHQLANLKKIPNVRGVDHAFPHSRAENIVKALGEQVVITSGLAPRGADMFASYEDYLRFLLSSVPKNARIHYIFNDEQPDALVRYFNIIGVDELIEELKTM